MFFADAVPLGTWSLPNLAVQWGPITDATHGMSGGAWVVNMSGTEADGKNVLVAVTSGAPPGPQRLGNTQQYPGGTFAAYLTAAEFNPLLSFVSGGCQGAGAPPTSGPGSGPGPGSEPQQGPGPQQGPEPRQGPAPSPSNPAGGGLITPNAQ